MNISTILFFIGPVILLINAVFFCCVSAYKKYKSEKYSEIDDYYSYDEQFINYNK